MITTLEGIVGSDELWHTVTIPDQATSGPDPTEPPPAGPHPADGPAAESTADTEGESGGAEDLADQAEEMFSGFDDAGFVPPQRAEPADQPPPATRRPPRRDRILAVVTPTPLKWFSSQDLAAAIDAGSYRNLRGVLSEMVRGGVLLKSKKAGQRNVYYRLAPVVAGAEETVVGG
ncbi:hypothetical protein G3I60_35220 [Streptomyces sp. SID13666]|uniref:hypothetical protein n=2 Tax=unclassified Streptomyces TaxID=2593676 RepID=UPI0013BF1179|nr:hypothetical protein [Streptomyces sp. SID13666]NEA59274.1 hypothetical protein [Streptomyces sp. SID13666]